MNPPPPQKKKYVRRGSILFTLVSVFTRFPFPCPFFMDPPSFYYFAGALLDSASIPGFHCRHAAFTKFSAISIKEFLNNLHHVLNIANAYALYGKIFT
jgi:hypothetical protein